MNKEALDVEDVLIRVQDDKELLIELLDIFEGFYPEKRELLDTLIKEGNLSEFKDVVHSIKGAAGNISAKALHDSCLKLEKMALEKDIESITKTLPDLDVQFQELQECIAEVKKDFQDE